MKKLKDINNPNDLKDMKIEDLKYLSDEIREYLIDSISNTGGHLASNLGIVELTIALHKVFNSPEDKFIFDVGHQSYIHKILTGRKDKLDTIRQYGGISGFTKVIESEHDIIATGHSSTSISAALGIAKGEKNKNNTIIAIIGDGGLTGGMAFEALNNISMTDENLIVILNDNDVFISERVGRISTHLSQISVSKIYNKTKKATRTFFYKIPIIGSHLVSIFRTIKTFGKRLLGFGFFEHFDCKYVGPIDGHDLNELIAVLKNAKHTRGPLLIHVKTIKGKGYKPAEIDPYLYHGVSKFDKEKGIVKDKSSSDAIPFTKHFTNYMINNEDDDVIAITAAMPSGTGLYKFKLKYPDRFYDVGIAEQHAVTFASGLSISGKRPVVAIYSTFIQRAYDQIIHDVAIESKPVTLVLDRAGLVGSDGETHHGVFDIAFMLPIPNFELFAPCDGNTLHKCLDYCIYSDKPNVIRIPRATVDNLNLDDLDIHKPYYYKKGSKALIIAVGEMLHTAIDTSNYLKEKGYNISIVYIAKIKPFEYKDIEEWINNHEFIYTIENGTITGGFGQYLSSFSDKNIVNLGIEDSFVPHGSIEELLIHSKLDLESIGNKILSDIK